jgi:signal transduction histidine kinase
MGPFSFVSIGALIDGTVLLLRRDPRVASKIEVTTAVEAGLPPMRLNADSIRQVLWNLCLNAVQALPCGGKISVSARALREGMREGVCIEVCDDGPGIAPERRERVFEPFETTNPNGTGLGLALVRSGIERHQGWVRIEDAPTGGACVRFWLPVSSDEE